MKDCASCGRPISPAEERYVPGTLRLAVAFALAFLHGGMWAMETLALPYCPRCRARLVLAGLLLLALAIPAACAGAWIWVHLARAWRQT